MPILLRVYYEAKSRRDGLGPLTEHPKTRELCLREGIPFVDTPRKGYVEDVRYLFREFRPFISVSFDLPFVTAGTSWQ
ncbi:hypothetical protein [Pyrococcus kukulkanii]|uniref:hypothetical protein n=1 Tax=Pyrococcus kukulkanii TaxID=1609559 RepID=UPI0035676720